MKKHVKSVLLLIGLILLNHPMLVEASEVFVQNSEVVEQTTIYNNNIKIEQYDDIELLKEVDSLKEEIKNTITEYNELVNRFEDLKIAYEEVDSDAEILSSFDEKEFPEITSLNTLESTDYIVTLLPVLRQSYAELSLVLDDLNEDFQILNNTCDNVQERLEDKKKEIREKELAEKKRREEEKRRLAEAAAAQASNDANAADDSNTNVAPPAPQGGCLTPSGGVFYGPSGKETYYNLDMSGVISIMRSMGYDEENYPYWVREDGVKMLGSYIMVAADLNVHPRGSLVPTSLGTGIVCDTGGFVSNGSGVALDIAVAW